MPNIHFAVDFKVHGLENRLEEAGPALDRVLRSAMVQSLGRLQAEVVRRTPVDLGTARNSVQPDIEGHAATMVGRLSSVLTYMPTLEEGRAPGKKPPPAESLIPWIKRHPRAPQSYLTRVGKKQSKAKPPTVEEQAYALAHAIGLRGQLGHHMFRDALAASRGTIEDTFEDAAKILTRILNGG